MDGAGKVTLEIEEELVVLAKQYGQEVEKMKETLKGNNEYIVDTIKRRKAIAFLVEHSKVISE